MHHFPFLILLFFDHFSITIEYDVHILRFFKNVLFKYYFAVSVNNGSLVSLDIKNYMYYVHRYNRFNCAKMKSKMISLLETCKNLTKIYHFIMSGRYGMAITYD